MSLIIYWPAWQKKLFLGPLLDAVTNIGSPQDVTFFNSFAAFSRLLRWQIYDSGLIVLIPGSRADLEEILLLEDLLLERQIVFVLPSDDGEMADRAYLLRPRYVTWQGGDFGSLKNILKRLLLVNNS